MNEYFSASFTILIFIANLQQRLGLNLRADFSAPPTTCCSIRPNIYTSSALVNSWLAHHKKNVMK